MILDVILGTILIMMGLVITTISNLVGEGEKKNV